MSDIKEKIQKIIELSEKIDVKDFTYSLITTIGVEFDYLPDSDIPSDLLEACVEEVSQSLEIMNPELKNDIQILEDLLSVLKN